MFSVNEVEQILIGYMVPFLILFGFTGNLLNLSILLSKGNITRSNILLASLAVCDIVFLLSMIPFSMAHYRVFYLNYAFRYLYVRLNFHLMAILNWVSATAIWLVLTICLERLMGIRYPLSVRKDRVFQTPVIILGIVTMTGLLSFYNHVAFDCMTREFCNGEQPHAWCIHINADEQYAKQNRTNPNPQWLISYVQWSPHVYAFFGVFLPTVVVLVSNALLIYTLRQRQKFLSISTNQPEMKSNQAAAQLRMEQKVTITVCAIVTCFTITQTPSGFVTLAVGYITGPRSGVIPQAIANFMVVVGKSLNFVLFCLSSTNFRQRLFMLTKARLSHRKKTRRLSIETEATTLTSAICNSCTNSMDFERKKKRSRTVSLSNTPVTTQRYIPLSNMRGTSVMVETNDSSGTFL
uniref:G-protein coupled receptors family 1 profile domain-containing protein n=1 Tax=Acrobeloides nanus TaxID=290746 RepID=A0A914DUY5_9BILA